MDVVPNQPFAVKMSNFREKHIKLQNVAVTGIAMPAPVPFMEIETEEMLPVGEP